MRKSLRRFKDIAEDLHKRLDEFRDQLITWEKLTELMHVQLPRTDLERMLWINKRTRWVNYINKAFAELKLPCQLSVVFDKGVELLEEKRAVVRVMNKDIKKIISTHNNADRRAKDMLKCIEGIDEKLSKKLAVHIKAYQNNITSSQFSFFGRIASDPDLNGMIDLQALRKLLPDS